jgi:hypothetical protein
MEERALFNVLLSDAVASQAQPSLFSPVAHLYVLLYIVLLNTSPLIH